MIRHAWNNTTRGGNRDGERTIGEACVEVIRDGRVELLVERIVEVLFFGGEHRKDKEVGRGRRRWIEWGRGRGDIKRLKGQVRWANLSLPRPGTLQSDHDSLASICVP